MIYHWAPLLFFEYYIIKPIFFIAMIDLLLSTFAMMGLTFLIGFFVAAVIKLIAYAADSFDFYSSHRLELLRLHRWRQHRQKVERLVRQMPLPDEGTLGDYLRRFQPWNQPECFWLFRLLSWSKSGCVGREPDGLLLSAGYT